MCRCSERRARIVEAAKAGNLETAAKAAAFVATTSVVDLAQTARIAAAKLRLRR